MQRLHADIDTARWVPVTGSLGWSGRRHRAKALRMLMSQATGALGVERPRTGRFAAWAVSQATPLLMRRADGRVLAWVWRDDPELLVVMAQIQQLTPQLRAARAMMPMEYDDTESFRHPTLGVGEKLVMSLPPRPETPPFATYTWDLGTALVTVTAVGGDRERFGTAITAVDEVARAIRVIDDVVLGPAGTTLRIEPT